MKIFKNLPVLLKNISILLVFILILFLFIGVVNKNLTVKIPVNKVSTKSSADKLNIKRILPKGGYYKIIAEHMKKLLNDTTLLKDAKLWYIDKSNRMIYIEADKAKIDQFNNITLNGNIMAKKGDFRVYTDKAFWDSKLEILSSDSNIRGSNGKDKIYGKGFKYFKKKDELNMNEVNIWIK